MVVFVLFYFVVVVYAYLLFCFLFLGLADPPQKKTLTEASPLDNYPECWMNALTLSLQRKPGFGFCAPLALC